MSCRHHLSIDGLDAIRLAVGLDVLIQPFIHLHGVFTIHLVACLIQLEMVSAAYCLLIVTLIHIDTEFVEQGSDACQLVQVRSLQPADYDARMAQLEIRDPCLGLIPVPQAAVDIVAE